MSSELDFESALRNVINELKAPKSQVNKFGGYKFRKAEDILEAAKPLLFKNGLRLKISDEIVLVGDRHYVKATVTVKGHGAQDTAEAYAREEDVKKGMDQSQITGAASSYARKYALNGMFDIDDTNDADGEDNTESGHPPSQKQIDLIRKLAKEMGTPDEGIEARLKQIKTSEEASEAIKRLKGDI